MTIYEDQLNDFFINIFNDILRLEEESLAKGHFENLSVNEMHVIEAVCDGESNCSNTMKSLSNKLMITASSLTISVKTLEQKGYLTREKDTEDKRKVLVVSTKIAKDAYDHHKEFHRNLIASVSETLNEVELAALTLALGTLHRFFITLKKHN
ncbi:MAG: MarR family transcriptional regulator [Clostridium sp.]|uniref:MarR family winged helix-turn-helix transcriptional regulator n=1 Tax=Clostridium sp. TaxID=1506 RepID=UPI00302A3C46